MEILENVRRQLENIQKFRKLDKLKRVVQKDGTTSVLYKNISKKRRRYFYDFYTTLLDSSWSYCVLMFASSFYGSWIFFAILYYTICYWHGDLEPENYRNKDWTPCINNIGQFLRNIKSFGQSNNQCSVSRWLRRQFSLLAGDSAHHRLRDEADHHQVHGGHAAGLAPGCPRLHSAGLHGGPRVLKTVETSEP